MPSDYCLGCWSFQTLTIYYILPDSFPNYRKSERDVCCKCAKKLMEIREKAEEENGGTLEMHMYYLIFKNFLFPKQEES